MKTFNIGDTVWVVAHKYSTDIVECGFIKEVKEDSYKVELTEMVRLFKDEDLYKTCVEALTASKKNTEAWLSAHIDDEYALASQRLTIINDILGGTHEKENALRA